MNKKRLYSILGSILALILMLFGFQTNSPVSDPLVEYSFRSEEMLEEHYEKHKDEFTDITLDQYSQRANTLVNGNSDNVITKYEDDGDQLFFDTVTGEFAVLSTDGYIRTFFIPDDGIDYYNRK